MRKIKRSRSDKYIFGVCAGLGDYFNIDRTIIRLAWFLLTIMNGTFGIAYLVCGIIIPEDDGYIYQDENEIVPNNNTPLFIGIGLIILGIYFLVKLLYPQLLSFSKYWPVLLIILGIYILINSKNDG